MNLPNKLSIARICLVPIFVACYFVNLTYMPIVAVGVFLLAAFTDFLDGYIARKYNLITDLGKLLDPIADKLLVTAALFVLVATNPLGDKYLIVLASFGILIVGRDLLIGAIRQIAASKGTVIQANILGKVKTVVQFVTLPIMLLLQCNAYGNLFNAEAFAVLVVISLVCMILVIVLTVVSAVVYIIQNRSVFK